MDPPVVDPPVATDPFLIFCTTFVIFANSRVASFPVPVVLSTASETTLVRFFIMFFVSSVKLLFKGDTTSTRSDIVVSEEKSVIPVCSSIYLAIFDKTPSESPTVPENIEARV